MIKGLENASRSMLEKMRNLQIVANNLANINTTGYKREIPFTEYVRRGENQPTLQLTDFTEGSLIETDNPFDLAITGKGFFAIKTNRGVELTKNGKFKVSEDGYLVTDDNEKVLGRSGEINFYENITGKNKDVKITANGEIKVDGNIVDQLMIVKMPAQKNLVRTENQKYYLPDNNYTPAENKDFSIKQGFLEESNTNPVIEMQAMIQLEKDYEAAQKMVASMDNLMSKSREIGKV